MSGVRWNSPRSRSAQVSREARLSVADDVIHNDGDLAALRDQVERLHREYVSAAAAKARGASRTPVQSDGSTT